MTTPNDIASIRALAERLLEMESKATKAPWHDANRGIGFEVHGDRERPDGCWIGPDCPNITGGGFRGTIDSEHDARIVAESRNAIRPLCSWLIAMIDALAEHGEEKIFVEFKTIYARAAELVHERDQQHGTV